MAHTYINLVVHVIYSTKDRHPHIDPDLRSRLSAYLGGVIRDIGGVPLIVNGTADHTHQLMSIAATRSIAEIVRLVKANSSKWVHETFPAKRGFAWQSGYGAFSVSQSNVDAVRQYIADQEEHHRTVTFQEEYLAFLRRHGIAFDERYVWE